MFGLKIRTPVNGIFELILVFFQNFYRLGVSYLGKIAVYYILKTLYKLFVVKVVKELHFIGTGVQYLVQHVFYHIPREIHIVLKIGEGYFRLYHPEFRSMAGGVGVFRAEGGTESVYLTESHRHGFPLKLPRYGEGGWLPEKVLRVIYRSVLGFGRIGGVKR